MPLEIPNKFKCPISHLIMIDPVVASDGHSYEREWIEWVDKSPLTGEKLKVPVKDNLFPNHDLRSDIQTFIANHPEVIDEDDVSMPVSQWLKLKDIIAKGDIKGFDDFVKSDKRYLIKVPEQAQDEGLISKKAKLPKGHPLSWAISVGNLDIVNKIRIAQGDQALESLDNVYPHALANKAFLDAVSSGELDVALKMVDEKRADINAFNHKGHNAIIVALHAMDGLRDAVGPEKIKRVKYEHFIDQLLKKGITLAIDNYHKTPAHYAIQFKQVDVLKQLIQLDPQGMAASDKCEKRKSYAPS